MPRRGMGVEIGSCPCSFAKGLSHAPQGHGSRNRGSLRNFQPALSHAPQGHGSRNAESPNRLSPKAVMPRRGMGVEIILDTDLTPAEPGHAPQGHGSRNPTTHIY